MGSAVANNRCHSGTRRMQPWTLKVSLYVCLLSLSSRVCDDLAQLLEDHLEKLRKDETGDMEEDDEAAWENWDVETDSSESDAEGWIDVSSDGEDLEVSDSDGEKEARPKDKAKDVDETDKDTRISTLATTKVESLFSWSLPPALKSRTDFDARRFRSAQRSPYKSRDRGSRKRRRLQG